MKKKTQKQIVENELRTIGSITNSWAWQHGIWRLASVINLLRKDGVKIITIEGTEKGNKNCKYVLGENTSKPKQFDIWA